MFDRTFIATDQGTKHVYETRNIHEHRAPTDESVKLLREMEKAAKDNFLGRFDFKDNKLNGTVAVMSDYLNNEFVLAILFSLNGREHRVEVRESMSKHKAITEDTAKYLLAESIAKAVTKELLCQTQKEKL
jgi:hypothetical protein